MHQINFSRNRLALAVGLLLLTACGTDEPAIETTAPITAEPVMVDLSATDSELVTVLPSDTNVLFWPQEKRTKAFSMMGAIAPMLVIQAGKNPQQLEEGDGLNLSWEFDGQTWDIDSYMQDQNAAGIMVIHNDEVRLQEYRLGFTADGRWTSFSVAKSFTSTLVGVAIKDGYIKSLSDLLTTYIPELSGSGYDGVTVKQLLTMTSGVQWNEDYADPNSNVAQFLNALPDGDLDPTVVYMRTLQREAEPGTRWQYNTGETNLIGVLVTRATGKSLSAYMSEKVWQPYGMTHEAGWMVNQGGYEISGCCISARLIDYALLGKFALEGGVIDGQRIVPEGWFDSAGSKHADIGVAGRGYGYQWWTYDDGPFAAQGIFGQGIFIDPKRNLVIASNGNWAQATNDSMKDRRNAFYRAVQAAVDQQE